MNKQDILMLLQKHELHPNKNLGQNFLIDEVISKRVATLVLKEKNTLEIGPGLGSLTAYLEPQNLTVVEIDRGYISVLKQRFPDLKIKHEDVLKEDFNQYDVIVGNIPYYITKDILLKIVLATQVSSGVLMVQKEVLSRLLKPENETLLTTLIHLTLELHEAIKVPRSAFYPEPNVDSTVFTFKRKNRHLDPQQLKEFLQPLFLHKRKKIKSSLQSAGEFMDHRIEELNDEEIIRLFMAGRK
ncbi:MAG: hypothetical protein LBR37_01505 [Erysipelotrichaceae bacterium]|jgi:16S rRNA (adenine1518-N6/adenine1519-N6)-dimethyltransferase|nr:hypothetical protein [Erysipelotrichaceae bacterium]